MDIPSTVLYHLEHTAPDALIGAPLQLAGTEKFCFLDSRKDTIGLVYEDNPELHKLIVDGDYNKEQLYDLKNGPGETINLVQSKPVLTQLMTNKRLSVGD